MSKAPDQLQQISALLPLLKTAREQVAEAENRVQVLDMRGTQSTASASVAGLRVELTYADHTTGYYPRVIPGRQSLLAECRKVAHEHLLACRSRVEGLEHKLRQLANGGAA